MSMFDKRFNEAFKGEDVTGWQTVSLYIDGENVMSIAAPLDEVGISRENAAVCLRKSIGAGIGSILGGRTREWCDSLDAEAKKHIDRIDGLAN